MEYVENNLNKVAYIDENKDVIPKRNENFINIFVA